MSRKNETPVAAPQDVLATLAELDDKLEALKRGMGAAHVGTDQGRAPTERSAPATGATVARSTPASEPRLRALAAAPDPTSGSQVDGNASPRSVDSIEGRGPGTLGSPVDNVDNDRLVATVSPAAHASQSYPVPEFGWKPVPPVDAVTLEASELSRWRARLARAIEELTALHFEIELASTRATVVTDEPSAAPPAADGCPQNPSCEA
jgi:hypothetical protein